MTKLPTMPRTHSEVERRIHKALEDDRAKQSDSASTIRLSSIGKCVRELWAIRTGIPDERPPEGQTLMTFDVGRFVEDAVIDWLIKAGYAVETRDAGGKQFRVEMPNRVGIGHLDGVIQWGSPRDRDYRLIEVKTAKAKKFEELLEAGSYRAWNAGYYDQIEAYMGASQTSADVPALSDCLVIVVCKDDSRLYCEMIRFDADHYATLEAKARTAMADEMPGKPPLARGKSSAFCKWCSRKEWCYSPMAGVEFDQ